MITKEQFNDARLVCEKYIEQEKNKLDLVKSKHDLHFWKSLRKGEEYEVIKASTSTSMFEDGDTLKVIRIDKSNTEHLNYITIRFKNKSSGKYKDHRITHFVTKTDSYLKSGGLMLKLKSN